MTPREAAAIAAGLIRDGALLSALSVTVVNGKRVLMLGETDGDGMVKNLEAAANALLPLVDQLAAFVPPPVCTGSGHPHVQRVTGASDIASTMTGECGICQRGDVPLDAQGRCQTHAYREPTR